MNLCDGCEVGWHYEGAKVVEMVGSLVESLIASLVPTSVAKPVGCGDSCWFIVFWLH